MAEEENKPQRWQPGMQSPNPYGRPKGSKNKKKEIAKSAAWNMLGRLMMTNTEDLKKLKPSERVRASIQLLSFFVPKAEQDKNDEGGNGNVQVIIKYEDKQPETDGDFEQIDFPTNETD